MRDTVRRSRLGVIVGAFFCIGAQTVSAQVVVPPASEVPLPPKPETDSAAPKPDSIKAAFGRMPAARSSDIGPRYEWDREELYASGAYTLADLLDRVPGATSFRTGWIMSPKFVAVNGDFQRVRIFYDGLEIDNLDTRNGTLLDLTTIDLFTLEHVAIERFGSELRVNLRSWRVERTEPYTRTDIYTGDEDTNIYRGFYGKRFQNGFGLQLAGQQWNTRSPRFGGGGDALSFLGRIGIARRNWSVDAYAVRRNGARTTQPTVDENALSLQPFEGTHTLAYVRGAFGNQSGGPWAEAIASYMRLGEESDHITGGEVPGLMLRTDTTDTTTHRAQYLLTAGITRRFIRASVGDRIRAFTGDIHHSPFIHLELDGKVGIVDLKAEREGVRERTRFDGAFRFTPLSFLAIGGGISYESPDNEESGDAVPVPEGEEPPPPVLKSPKSVGARIEAGIKLGNPWLIGGYITRDTTVLEAPQMIDSAYQTRAVGKRSGVYGGIRGQLYKDLNIDVVATRWDSAGFYQPRFQSRSELNLNTRWLRKFPSGTFGLKLAAIHEYRNEVRFPTADGFRETQPSNITSALVEIRILRGVASYQARNVFAKNWQIFPGFFMHRTINIYGIRWEFWN